MKFVKKKWVLPAVLITTIIFVAGYFLSASYRGIYKDNNLLTKRVSTLENELNEASDRYKKRFWDTCMDPQYPCNVLFLNEDTFVGKYTSRKRIVTYSFKIPNGWKLQAYSTSEYLVAASIGSKTAVTLSSYGNSAFGEKDPPRVKCNTGPSLGEYQELMSKYGDISTEFGILRFGTMYGEGGENELYLCQPAAEGYPDFITDTSIGVIKILLGPSESAEIDKFIRAIREVKVTDIRYQ
jgi:hypothetical protein